MRGLLLACLAAGPAAAEPVPAVEAVLDRALAEQRMMLTCSALDPNAFGVFGEQWEGIAADTVARLEAAGYDPEAIARFRERSRVEALLPLPEAPFAEVRSLCAEAGDWRQRVSATLQFSILPRALDGLLAP